MQMEPQCVAYIVHAWTASARQSYMGYRKVKVHSLSMLNCMEGGGCGDV